MVYVRRGAGKRAIAVGGGVATPLLIEVATKGKRSKIGKMKVKQSALIGSVVGGLALAAGVTETGVHGEDADSAVEYGAGALATSIGLHMLSRPGKKRKKAGLEDEEIALQEEEELGEGLEDAGFGLAVKEY